MFQKYFNCFIIVFSLVVASGWDQVNAQTIAWKKQQYNPKPADDDYVLPLPCGGAMVFRKIVIPAKNLLDDRRIILGSATPRRGYSEYSRAEFLAGSFSDLKARFQRHFWIGKYEVTKGQWKAIQEDCSTRRTKDRLPVTEVGWYDAVRFTHQYNSWLYKYALDQIPQEDGIPGYVRLPTEAEWEFSARGGIVVTDILRQKPVFPMPDGIGRYVWHQGTESANGSLQPIGLLKANPVGLHDILGNAEEIVLEPFRLNKLFRMHGQAGGFITKGGHYFTPKNAIRSSIRTEYSHFDHRTRRPTSVKTIGFRVLIGANVVPTRQRLREVQEQWNALVSLTPFPDHSKGDSLVLLLDLASELKDKEQQEKIKTVVARIRNEIAVQNSLRSSSVKSLIWLGAFLGNKVRLDFYRLRDIRKAVYALERAKMLKNLIQSDAENKGGQTSKDDLATHTVAQDERIVSLEKNLEKTFLTYRKIAQQMSIDYESRALEEELQVVLVELRKSSLEYLENYSKLFVKHVFEFRSTKTLSQEHVILQVLKPREYLNP